MTLQNNYPQHTTSEANDLLVELLEKSDYIQKAKKAGYKKFYHESLLPWLNIQTKPTRSGFGFTWQGFLQAFGTMCLFAITAAIAWLLLQNFGLLPTNLNEKVVNNEQVVDFDSCQKNGGSILNENGIICRFEGEDFPVSPIDNKTKIGNDNLSQETEDQDPEGVDQANPKNNGQLITTGSCTQEIKYCLDGSIVRRDPKNGCHFMLCPEEITASNSNTCSTSFDGVCPSTCTQQTDADCCRESGGVLTNGQCTTLR